MEMISKMANSEASGKQVVLVVGGAVAGSEAVAQFTQQGILTIVMEQNPRPYGKIEDGLPRWHVKLRRQEYDKIDAKLSHPNVRFIPLTKLGHDITLEEILGWGLSAVCLANGAWRDRPLPIAGIDAHIERGFYYQNPFVYWFNHYEDPGYDGPKCEAPDGAIVVGGGLASLDVVKILQLEAVGRALKAKGLPGEMLELEHKGIKRSLDALGITMADLGVKGCTLYYRRRVEDMPLQEPTENPTPEQLAKTGIVRRKLLQNFLDKYQFIFHERHAPVGLIVEDDRLAGLKFAETEVKDGRAVLKPGREKVVLTPLVISSIGSIPEPLQGIEMKGELYRIKDENSGEVEGLPGVFALGNAVTGKGNIQISFKHGRLVGLHICEYLRGQPALTSTKVAAIEAKVKALQEKVGYAGNYKEWLAKARHFDRLSAQPERVEGVVPVV
jgi:NADPH-dependent glutamate synthase beta subunit-like oxidoreductase